MDEISPFENLMFGYERISNWLLPDTITNAFGFALLFLALCFLLLAALLNPLLVWKRSIKEFLHSPNVIFLVFVLVYGVFILLTTFTADHIDSFDDRYQLVLFIPLLMLILLIADRLILTHQKPISVFLFVGLFVLWCIYQGSLSRNLIVQSQRTGLPYYNIYNTADFRRSGFIKTLMQFDFGDSMLYSNNAAAVYFFTQQKVDNSPNDPNNFEANENELMNQLETLEFLYDGFLIWFTPNNKRNYYSPEQLTSALPLCLLFEEPDGAVYGLGRPCE